VAAENGGFLATYYWAAHYQTGLPLNWFSLGAILIVVGGTVLGYILLLLYYWRVIYSGSTNIKIILEGKRTHVVFIESHRMSRIKLHI
jgi:hypothetical protein